MQGLRTGMQPSATTQSAPVVSATPSQGEMAAQAEIRHKIEQQLAQSPEYMRFFDQLKLVYPTEYEAIIDAFARRATKEGATDGIDAMMSDAVRDLRISHGLLAAKANGPLLQRIFTMQLEMMRVLGSKDPRLCVDFLYGSVSQAFFGFSAEHRSLVADMALAGLDAIHDGQQSRIERAAPTDTDFQQVEKALRDRGLSTPEVEALLDGKTPDPPIPETRMCSVGQTYLQAMSDLPEAPRLRLYGLAVELMARS